MHFVDRESKYPNRWTLQHADGTSEIITLIRNDEPIVDGTPMNAATLNTLSDVAGADVAREQAEAARDAAKTSETNAASSQKAAATSASNAKTSETNAASSQKAAASSQTAAASSASAAKTSETNAASSQKATASSQSAAAASASAAKTSETNAASSASAAATSASNAKTSETNAASSKTAAASSASAAATSASAAKKSETTSKEYLEQVKTITLGAQGWYETPEALAKAVPIGENGWWAVIGSTDTIWVWDSDSSAWKDTFTVTELGDYYTREQIDGKLEGKAECILLASDANLNNITTPGFYNCGGGNSLVNKPSGLDAIGLIVVHNAAGAYYTQIVSNSGNTTIYRRTCINGTWSAWTADKYTDTNTWRGIQNNLTSDSTTDSLSAAQGKALKALVDGKASQSHIHLNGTKSGAVDWNTFITFGTYKIQNCTMTDAYHAPAGEYAYGILQILDSENGASEKRIIQIYWPHKTSKGNHFWYRMHNGSDISTGWNAWTAITKKPATAGTADVANSVDWSKVQNKPNTYTPASHTHAYLPTAGGTMTGDVTFTSIGDTNTSNKITWQGSTDGADIYYQTTAANQGNLVLNLRDDSNCYLRIAKNGTFKSYFSPDDGAFHGTVYGNVSGSSGSCTGNSATATTAAKLGRGGNTGVPMTFNWSGQSGQPSWLWGGNDGTNMYVYNPSNFSVNYANNGVSASGSNYVRFGDGTQVCWGNITIISYQFAKSETSSDKNSSKTSQIVLPQPFADANWLYACNVDAPLVTNHGWGNTYDWYSITWGKTTNKATVGAFNKGVSGFYVAIGRWK